MAGLTLAWGVLWPLSCFSKETGLLFPLFALAWELICAEPGTADLDRSARVFAVLLGTDFGGGLDLFSSACRAVAMGRLCTS